MAWGSSEQVSMPIGELCPSHPGWVGGTKNFSDTTFRASRLRSSYCLSLNQMFHETTCIMGIHDDKTSVMGIHDDKTSSSRKRPNRNFSIKQNNHKFTQLRNKDLSSSLDVDLISSLSFIAKTLLDTKVSATFICGQVEYMI